ncbi:metal-dependent hydrolase [Massilia sp. TWR1-2-2]|uniref:metal-dependent hydrolase n=1 Tax=Massilia sp. TWR1-2-2 TaxID=2804584 RepID=UPI003CF61C01
MATLTVRKLNVDLSKGFGRHWLGGDPYRTQLFNALSMTFPLGEQSFIDSVRAIPEAMLPDPAMRAEIREFIGQEASHRFVHAQYNRVLAAQGLVFVCGPSIGRRLQRVSRAGPEIRVAATCAIEHYTAMLADGVLALPSWMEGAEPDMHLLWSWHAAEENEHKAVAIDVYRAIGGRYVPRVLVYMQASFFLAFDIFWQTADNLRRDGQLWKARTWISACRTWLGRDGIFWHLLLPSLRYLAPSFHPWQHDNRQLSERWLDEHRGAFRSSGARGAQG